MYKIFKSLLIIPLLLSYSVASSATFADLHRNDKDIIKSYVGDIDLGQANFKRLSGGYSGAGVFLVTTEEGKVIFKVLPKNGSKGNEKEVMFSILAGKSGVGPKVLFPQNSTDTNNSLLVIDYIGKDEPSYDDVINNQSSYIAIIKRIHKQSISGNNYPEASYAKKEIQHQIKEGAKLNDAIISLNNKINDSLNKLEFTKTIIHGDLHEKQVIISGGDIFVIDWRNAGLGDPFYDIASFTTILGFTKEQSIKFFNEYMDNNASDNEKQRFILRYYQNLIRLLAFVDKSINSMDEQFQRQNNNQPMNELFKRFSYDDFDLSDYKNLNDLANSILDVLDNYSP